MFAGLNNNRAHWKELADVYQAKLDAIENEKKKQEDKKGLFKATDKSWLKKYIPNSHNFFY